MNTTKILIILAFLGFCCVTFTQSIKCYTCTSVNDCKRPKSYECTQQLANKSREYLDIHHKDVPMNTTSPSYKCFLENLKISTGEYHYKGCSYSNINVCDLRLRDYIAQGQSKRNCYECNNRDGCNPADRAAINSMMTLLVACIVVLSGRYM